MTTTCCPEFNPEAWNEKRHTWKEKKFARDRVFCFFYIPLTFGSAIRRLMKKLEKAQAQCPDWLCLSDHTSKWNMDIYLAVDRDLPNTIMQTVSGQYLSKVYEGPFRDTRIWCDDFAAYAKREGVTPGKTFMWYTTCPRCAKKRGKNFVVIVAEIKALNENVAGA